jgi:hypothetical protein
MKKFALFLMLIVTCADNGDAANTNAYKPQPPPSNPARLNSTNPSPVNVTGRFPAAPQTPNGRINSLDQRNKIQSEQCPVTMIRNCLNNPTDYTIGIVRIKVLN